VPAVTGIQRAAWNLNSDPTPEQLKQLEEREGGRGGRGQAGGGGRGRGGTPQGPPVPPGRYTATLGTLAGETFTPIGDGQTFMVVKLNEQ
jgi:hypothetical protein